MNIFDKNELALLPLHLKWELPNNYLNAIRKVSWRIASCVDDSLFLLFYKKYSYCGIMGLCFAQEN